MTKRNLLLILAVLGLLTPDWACKDDGHGFQSEIIDVLGIRSIEVIHKDTILTSNQDVEAGDIVFAIRWQTRSRTVRNNPVFGASKAYALSPPLPRTDWKVAKLRITDIQKDTSEDISDHFLFTDAGGNQNKVSTDNGLDDLNASIEFNTEGLDVHYKFSKINPSTKQLRFQFWGEDSSYFEGTTIAFTLTK
ncbi:MAG: hypothetical protein JJ975_07570 [Bacteroidia bacterium]|nr:hypothetical protein [Bacteroidia bacterium]